MAKSRKKASDDTPLDTDPLQDTISDLSPVDPPSQAAAVIESVAESTRPPGDTVASQHTRHQSHTAHIANPSSVRRESHTARVGNRLPSKVTATAGDMKVHLIDKDNLAGVGIVVEFPEGSTGRPTAEEKEIIRKHIKGEDSQSGFSWNGQFGMWHKDIVRQNEHPDDVPPTRPVAIRLDAENRVQKLADALRQHSDPVGYAEQIKGQREQSSSSDPIPF